MSKIYFGYTTQSHGLKGELKCYTDFERKDIVLQKNYPVYIEGKRHVISSVRPHKNYYLLTFDHLEDINLVENFRHQDIYIKKEELPLKEGEFLYSDLIGFSLLDQTEILGKIENVRYNKGGILLEVLGSKRFFVPFNDAYIKKVSLKEKIIEGQNIKGLIL